jgi:hypothetical protein
MEKRITPLPRWRAPAKKAVPAPLVIRRLAPRYGAGAVELLPARVLPPPAVRPLPAHWPRGGEEGERLVKQLREKYQ